MKLYMLGRPDGHHYEITTDRKTAEVNFEHRAKNERKLQLLECEATVIREQNL